MTTTTYRDSRDAAPGRSTTSSDPADHLAELRLGARLQERHPARADRRDGALVDVVDADLQPALGEGDRQRAGRRGRSPRPRRRRNGNRPRVPRRRTVFQVQGIRLYHPRPRRINARRAPGPTRDARPLPSGNAAADGPVAGWYNPGDPARAGRARPIPARGHDERAGPVPAAADQRRTHPLDDTRDERPVGRRTGRPAASPSPPSCWPAACCWPSTSRSSPRGSASVSRHYRLCDHRGVRGADDLLDLEGPGRPPPLRGDVRAPPTRSPGITSYSISSMRRS